MPPSACAREEREERSLHARDVEDEPLRIPVEDGRERGRRMVERCGDQDDVGFRGVVERARGEAARGAGGVGDADGEALPAKEAREETAHAPRAADEEDPLRAALPAGLSVLALVFACRF